MAPDLSHNIISCAHKSVISLRIPIILLLSSIFLNKNIVMLSYSLYVFSIALLIAPPLMLNKSDPHAFVPETANIVLSFNITADPAPTATWRLNDDALPTMTTPSLE